MELHKQGVLDSNNVELIGAQVAAIEKAEDRERFKDAMDSVGIQTAKGGFVKSWKEAESMLDSIRIESSIDSASFHDLTNPPLAV